MSDNLHSGHRQRIKKRYRKEGLTNFESHEALELLLYYGYKRMDTNEKAHKMIEEFGSLSNLLEAGTEEIMKRCNVSENIAVLISMILPLNKKYMQGKFSENIILDSSKKAGKFATSLFIGEKDECIYLICMNTQKKVLHAPLVSRGVVNEAHVYPRTVAELCLNFGAVNIFIAHNHPSGLLEPSDEDLDMTEAIEKTLNPLGINVLDHFIVCDNKYISFAERKLL